MDRSRLTTSIEEKRQQVVDFLADRNVHMTQMKHVDAMINERTKTVEKLAKELKVGEMFLLNLLFQFVSSDILSTCVNFHRRSKLNWIQLELPVKHPWRRVKKCTISTQLSSSRTKRWRKKLTSSALSCTRERKNLTSPHQPSAFAKTNLLEKVGAFD
jgi:hypothetical protein